MARLNETSRPGWLIAQGSTLVCSTSALVAEAFAQALGLKPVQLVELRPGLIGLRAPSRSNGAPSLAIVCGPDAETAVRAVRLIKRRWPKARVLVAGVANREASVLRCLAAGADGLVLPDESLAQLRTAMREVAAGGFRPPPNLRPFFNRLITLAPELGGVRRLPRATALSTREREILTCLAAGLSNKDIARQLHLEVQTVKNHVGRLMHKLGVRTRHDAVRVSLAAEGSAA